MAETSVLTAHKIQSQFEVPMTVRPEIVRAISTAIYFII